MGRSFRSLGIAAFLFVVGSVNLYFANGIHATLFAAWLAPIFLLRFSRTTRKRFALPLLAMAAAAATWAGFKDLMPLGEAEAIALGVSSGITVAIIFLIDRLIAPKLSGIAATLVFPAATVTALLIGSLGAPFGTWGNDAYMQYEFLWLSRLSSILGVWGVAFLPAWFAAVVNQWIEAGFQPPNRQRSAIAMGLVSAFVLGHGALTGLQWRNAPDTVTAGLVGGVVEKPDIGSCDPVDRACRQAQLDNQYIEPLLARSAGLVERGAQLIAWPEAGAAYLKGEEPEYLELISRFAAENNVYVVAGLAALPDGPAGLIENKVVVFAPDGRWSEPYFKAHPVPGEPVVAGDGKPLLFDTRFGRLAVLICFDADFTAPARNAARGGADLLVVPSNDWAEITPLHAQMAAFRGMETGLPILRPTTNGLSAVISPSGDISASADSFAGQDVLLAPVQLAARPTLQRQLGDSFAWLCGLALVGLIGLRVIGGRRPI